jgi:hypothetical protein
VKPVNAAQKAPSMNEFFKLCLIFPFLSITPIL